MGKYKQWLHHQEVGRRLREQIATHEQERERVQRMAPSHPTTLPDTNNPLVRALLDYTGRGNTLGRAIGGKISGLATGDPQERRPAENPAWSAPAPASSAPPPPTGVKVPPQASAAAAPMASDDPIVARLAANAAQMPVDPLESMRQLAQSQSAQTQSAPPAAGKPPAPPSPQGPAQGDTSNEWFKRFRSQQ